MVAVEDHELGDVLSFEREAALEERLAASRAAQQREPERELVRALVRLFAMERLQLVVLDLERARDLSGALARGAEPQEVERTIVRHGLEADAAEEQRLLAQRLVEALAVSLVEPAALTVREPEPEAVERLPRLDRERLADGAGVLARPVRGGE